MIPAWQLLTVTEACVNDGAAPKVTDSHVDKSAQPSYRTRDDEGRLTAPPPPLLNAWRHASPVHAQETPRPLRPRADASSSTAFASRAN